MTVQKVVACPECKAPMKKRRDAVGGFFMGCSAYPACNRAVRVETKRPQNYSKARNLVVSYLTKRPSGKLSPLAKKLRSLLKTKPKKAIKLILGPRTDGATFKSLWKKPKGPSTKDTGWDDPSVSDAKDAPSTKELRKGIREYEDRPTEPYTLIEQGSEGGEEVPSSKFKLHKIKYPKLNPVQSLVLPWHDKDVNLVVASSTSSGKTVSAEMLMASSLARQAKAIFLSPLKAVSQEKYDDWTSPGHPWGSKNVEISTGDYSMTDARKKALAKAHVIVQTTEMLDAKSRRMVAEGNHYLVQSSVLCVDEAHLLTMEGRGDALECGLMRVTKQNPFARVVLLSATMPNIDELGRWLTTLNGKPTVVIRSAWRPTQLEVNWLPYNDKGGYHAAEQAKQVAAKEIVAKYPQDKFIVFVHSKRAGYELLKGLQRQGVQAEFHNADVERDKRLALVKRFMAPLSESKLRVVVATSTLAWGCNLPARRVIVLGVHRGMDEVSPIDVHQEVGRAGRLGLDVRGDAYVLLPHSRYTEMKHRFSTVPKIESCLPAVDVLAFHLTTEIAEGGVSTLPDAQAWYARSFAAFQGEKVELPEVLERLVKVGILKALEGEKKYEATMLGKVSSWLYFSPFDIADWCSNFRILVSHDKLKEDACLAWAFGSVKTAYKQFLPRDHQDAMQDLEWKVKGHGIEFLRLPVAALAAYGGLQGKDFPGIAGVQRGLQNDAERICQALGMIDKYVLRSLGPDYVRRVSLRIRYGCTWAEADLCRIPGVGAKRARALMRDGLRTPAHVVERPGAVRALLGGKIGPQVVRAAKQLLWAQSKKK